MELTPSTQQYCPFCSTPIDPSAFFCPTCGKNVKDKPLPTDSWTQIGLYLESIMLPPLFIMRTIRYMKSADRKTKTIGMVSLGLTVVTLLIITWSSIAIAKTLSRDVDMQLNQYQDIGL